MAGPVPERRTKRPYGARLGRGIPTPIQEKLPAYATRFLTPTQEKVLKLRGYGGGRWRTLEEIGREFGISKQAAHDTEQAGLKRIRRALADLELAKRWKAKPISINYLAYDNPEMLVHTVPVLKIKRIRTIGALMRHDRESLAKMGFKQPVIDKLEASLARLNARFRRPPA